ncbi:hypothetical protein IJM86_08845 [bacterium]|nr:hypothetical protein [bacterium]
MAVFNLSSCTEKEDSLVCDLWYYSARQLDLNLGIFVEEDAINGTYLVFKNDSVFDGFLDKMDKKFPEDRESLVQEFYDKGFISRKSWEEQNPEAKKHPSLTFSLLINPDGLIKIGDTLYQDVLEQQLFSVNEKGEKTFIKGNVSKALPRESRNSYDITEDYPFNGFTTLQLDACLNYEVRVIRDDIVYFRAGFYLRGLNTGSIADWKRAYGDFDVYTSFDYTNEDGNRTQGENHYTANNVTGYSNTLAKSWRLNIDSFSVKVFAQRQDGKSLTLTVKL